MKKLITIVLSIAFAGVLLQSCKGDKAGDPKEAATAFLNSLKDMDYEKAKELGTDETDKMLDMMSAFSSMMPDSLKEEAKKITFNISDAKVEGDACTVTFSSSDAPGNTDEIKLIKVDGKWLVDMKMDMPTGDAPMDAPSDVPADAETPADAPAEPAK